MRKRKKRKKIGGVGGGGKESGKIIMVKGIARGSVGEGKCKVERGKGKMKGR